MARVKGASPSGLSARSSTQRVSATARARTGELYDLARDPQELQNRWDDPELRPVRVESQERLLDILVATEDRSQVREAYW